MDDKGKPIPGSKAALVYGQMNEPPGKPCIIINVHMLYLRTNSILRFPGARARVALTGLAIAEYFRDQEGQDVLLFVDNIFRLDDNIYRKSILVLNSFICL